MVRVVLCAFALLFSFQLCADCSYPTYFRYSREVVREIGEKASSLQMSEKDLKKWDDIVRKLNTEHPIGANLYRLRAYLYTAQRDAAFLSYYATGKFVGSVDPVSHAVVSLFFEDVPKEESDEYSELLSSFVMAKIKARFDAEKEKLHEYPLSRGDAKLKDFPKPISGLEVATWTPWLLDDPKKFLPAAPSAVGDVFWKEQAKKVKEVVSEVTLEQKEQVLFWSGKSKVGSGEWIQMTTEYMDEQHTPFCKYVFVRAVMAEGGVDTDIAVYFTKFTYAIPRPWMVDSAIVPLVDKPRHPSFPSGHAALSAMYARLLTYFFHTEEIKEFRLARDAALSRVWGGIHFPVDTWEGRKMGLKIGDEIVYCLRNQDF